MMQPYHQDGPPLGGQAAILRAIVQEAHKITHDIAPVPLTARAIQEIAALGLAHPERLSVAQIRKLCGSLMAHGAPVPS